VPAPLTREEFLCRIAAETARMSYPGSMSRGKHPVVRKGTKLQLEKYYLTQFPIAQVWDKPLEVVQSFDTWHETQSRTIAEWIKPSVFPSYSSIAVSTKFLNTFLHQLMKYELCRPLWKALHLPLDRRVFDALKSLRPSSLSSVHSYFQQSPYKLDYEHYVAIQQCLSNYVAELNCRPGNGMSLTSRIELNWLWI
jgi:hypothetical protein